MNLVESADELHDEAASLDDGLPNPPGAMLTDRVLLAVRRSRIRQDERDGILRDYRDGTAGTRFHGPAISIDKANVFETKRAVADALKNSRISWRHYLELAVAEAVSEANERKLQAKLIEVAAVAVAWAEGIHIRADDRRIAVEQRAMAVKDGRIVPLRPSWWWRLLTWLRLK